MSAGSLDTNALLRYLLEDIPEQHELVRRLLARSRSEFMVADTAFIELAFVLERHYGLRRADIALAIENLLAMERLSCNRVLLGAALEVFTAHPGLSFEDCYLAAHAELNDAEPLWTFDKKLSRQTRQAQLIM